MHITFLRMLSIKRATENRPRSTSDPWGPQLPTPHLQYYICRWHLGYCDKGCLPRKRGIDEYRGILSSQTEHFKWGML